MSIAETIRKPFPITPDRPEKMVEAEKLARLGWSAKSLSRRYGWTQHQAQQFIDNLAKGKA